MDRRKVALAGKIVVASIAALLLIASVIGAYQILTDPAKRAKYESEYGPIR